MDQNSDNGTDKRSWRERLGIGAGKDMPRIADEFAAAAPAAKAAVRPAPMAPRPGVKAAPPRGAAPAPSPDKLAEKLKAQRDAQERLAEQRVQAARQRTEIRPSEGSNGSSNGSKPKFTFAAEEAEAAAKATLPVPPMPQPRVQAQVPPVSAKPANPPRTMVPPPVIAPPMTPPRQPLGGDRPVMPQRPAAPPPVMPTRPQQRYSPPPAPTYNPQGGYGASPAVPPYRPVDPNARGYGGGYAPPPAYVPPVAGYNNQPRLNVPTAPSQAGAYGADSFDTRARNLRPPARPGMGYRDDYAEADVFADPRGGPRRATAGDYSQAYRDEQGYDEDLPPSRGPWVPLLMLLLLALIAGGGVWYMYQSAAKAPTAGGQSGNAPVVEAPAQPAKVTPDPVQQPAGQPSKKLIYDRIVGDREILNGDVMQSEEVPAQPGDSTNLQDGDPATPQDGAADPAQPTGQEDLVPLPLPPPPGEDGAGDQQGAAPSNKTSNEAMIQPAAGESQAAVPSQDSSGKSDPPGVSDVAKSELPVPPAPASAEAAPVPGETEAAAAATGTEAISDAPAAAEPAPDPEPVVKKKVAETAAKPKKAVTKKAEKSLGSKPVVLVPPADGSEPVIADQQVASIDNSADGGLYNGDTIVDPGTTPAAAPTPAPIKKKKTLADLFRGDTADDAVAPLDAAAETPVPPPAPVPAKKVQAAPQPAPQPAQQQVASAGGYVVQLASFPNQADASKEYGRLKAKHGGALSGLSPIVSQAIVGGSTRYRLAVGVMASREQASAVCAKLFAAGERDCLVRRQ